MLAERGDGALRRSTAPRPKPSCRPIEGNLPSLREQVGRATGADRDRLAAELRRARTAAGDRPRQAPGPRRRTARGMERAGELPPRLGVSSIECTSVYRASLGAGDDGMGAWTLDDIPWHRFDPYPARSRDRAPGQGGEPRRIQWRRLCPSSVPGVRRRPGVSAQAPSAGAPKKSSTARRSARWAQLADPAIRFRRRLRPVSGWIPGSISISIARVAARAPAR